jgi:hypothetical protein
MHIDHAPPREVAFERASAFLFDLSPSLIGNGSKLAL